MDIKEISSLSIGNKVKFNDTIMVVIGFKENGDCLISKQPKSPYIMSIPKYSHAFNDLHNRIEVYTDGH